MIFIFLVGGGGSRRIFGVNCVFDRKLVLGNTETPYNRQNLKTVLYQKRQKPMILKILKSLYNYKARTRQKNQNPKLFLNNYIWVINIIITNV